MGDPSHSRGRRPTQGDPARRGAVRTSSKIEAVSGALMARRSLLDRPPSPAKINLLDVARLIGEVPQRPNALVTPASRDEGQSISLDPTRIKLPEEEPAAGSKDLEGPRDEEGRSGQTKVVDLPWSVDANDDRTPTSRAIPTAFLPMTTAAANAGPTPIANEGPSTPSSIDRVDGSTGRTPEAPKRPEEKTVPATRSSPSTAIGAASGGLQGLGGVGETQARPDAASAVGAAGRPDPTRVDRMGRPSGRDGAVVSPTATSTVGPPQSGEGVKMPAGSRDVAAVRGAFAEVARPGSGADQQPNSSVQAGPSMSFVRNPLSREFKDFSMSGPAPTGQGGASSDRGGIGQEPGEAAPNGSISPDGGMSGDFSRTNELLQQLIDAVRRQRGSSLPPGGPPVYPDR